MSRSPFRLGVLISGRGSNLQSIVASTQNGALDASVGIVISDRAGAAGLARARESGVEGRWIAPGDYASRAEHDRAIAAVLREHDVDLVCLAGYMRLVGRPLLEAFPQRILNVHPSLLPAFPGRDAQRQALEHGVRVSGATVHLVTPELDNGPIILQSAVPVLDGDTVETLSARILVEEHRLYPEAIRMVLDGEWSVDGRRFCRRPE
jgi:phosphoribosylglycinamide formyltransferase-1